MAFYGNEFIFDGVSCKEYGLTVYNFGGTGQGNNVLFTSSGEVVRDSVLRRNDSFMYGLKQDEPLRFEMTFGANLESIDAHSPLSRQDIEAISSWLTGHSERKYLQIVQADMEGYRYKCTINNLRLVLDGDEPWAFNCEVECDSPYAYLFPESFIFSVNNTTSDIILQNDSSCNSFYLPKINITLTQGVSSFSITNNSDGGRIFGFGGLPTGEALTIAVDNANQVITDVNGGTNLYGCFNKKFFRMKRGDNRLSISCDGNATVEFICEFPVSIGG